MGLWLPLESNPEVLNPFARTLGLPEPWAFCDVFGLDEELLAMVPQPCVAVCLLYPSEKISKARREELAALPQGEAPDTSIFFCQQHDGIGNACGTIACMHAISNAALQGAFELKAESPLRSFIEKTSSLGIAERGHELLNATELQILSDSTAAAGTTEGAGTDDAQGQHFIAFVNFGDKLYELDGRNFARDTEGATAKPVCHGPTSQGTFLADAAKVVREQFMARDPGNVNFNIVALCKDA